MKKRIEEIANEKIANRNAKKMTRKEAIKKSGYMVVSAATMMILLSNPNKAQAQVTSPSPPPAW